MPDLGPPKCGSSQRQLLHEFGELHEQQAALRELAAERIPDHASAGVGPTEAGQIDGD